MSDPVTDLDSPRRPRYAKGGRGGHNPCQSARLAFDFSFPSQALVVVQQDMPFEGKSGPDTGQTTSAVLANMKFAHDREVDRLMERRMALAGELWRAFHRLAEYAAADSIEEFHAEMLRQEQAHERTKP